MSNEPRKHLLIALCLTLLSFAVSAERRYQVVLGVDKVNAFLVLRLFCEGTQSEKSKQEG